MFYLFNCIFCIYLTVFNFFKYILLYIFYLIVYSLFYFILKLKGSVGWHFKSSFSGQTSIHDITSMTVSDLCDLCDLR